MLGNCAGAYDSHPTLAERLEQQGVPVELHGLPWPPRQGHNPAHAVLRHAVAAPPGCPEALSAADTLFGPAVSNIQEEISTSYRKAKYALMEW
jgi:hypothetical protein